MFSTAEARLQMPFVCKRMKHYKAIKRKGIENTYKIFFLELHYFDIPKVCNFSNKTLCILKLINMFYTNLKIV